MPILLIALLARSVLCVSPRSSVVGPLPITVTVHRNPSARGTMNATFANEEDRYFHYAVPEISDFSPGYGPMSGGTTIILRGSAFNISNVMDSTSVEVGGFICPIQ